MKNKPLHLLTFLLLCLAMPHKNLFAQHRLQKGTLSGKVVYSNGNPAESVTVFIKSVNKHTLTDEKGFFKLENLPLGKEYTVKIIPFSDKGITIKADLRKKSADIVITLNNDEGISLSEVTVSGSSGGKALQQKGYAVNVISTQKALTQNIQTTELLGRSTGIKIRQSAGLGSDVSFNLNGLTGNSVRIFIDGIPLRNYGRSFSLSSIPPSMIERIEVYKGVLPAELSEDALGGGINVVLKKQMQNHLSASYSYGSFNTHQWDVNGAYRDSKSGFIANLSSFYNTTDNNYKVWGENVFVTDNITGEYRFVTAKRFHDKYYSSGIKTNVGFTGKKWADEMLLGFMLSETKKDIQTGATMQVVYGNRRTEYDTKMASLQYKKSDFFIKGLDVSTFMTYSKTNRAIIDTVPYIYTWEGKIATGDGGKKLTWQRGAEADSPSLANFDERNLANRSNLHYHLGRNHKLGVSYFLGTFTRKLDDILLPKDVRERLDKRKYNKQVIGFNYDLNLFGNKLKSSLFYKIYLQSVQLTEFKRNRLPNGNVRDEVINHNRDINDKGYGITLSYTITPKIVIALSGEKAIRLPGSSELLGNSSQGISSNLSLKPEYGNNGNLGLNFGTFQMGKHEFASELNFFIRDIRDMIIRGIPRPSDDFFRFENLGKIISRGVDAEVRYNWDKRLFVTANVSNFNARFNLEYDPDTGLRYAHYRSRLRNTPYLTANAHTEYIFTNLIQKESRLAINYNFGYTHEFFKEWDAYGAVGKAIIPSQPLHDVGATYTFPSGKLTLAFNAKNIFDTQVFDNFALQKPGRALFGKITYIIR